MNEISLNTVVLGGSGFIGSHVADQLSEAGHRVTIFDLQDSKWRRVDQEFIQGDIQDRNLLKTTIQGSDVVYHFAGLSSLNHGRDKAFDSACQNIIGTINVLDACREISHLRLMYASTVYVNGRSGGFYRCSKQAAENYIEEYSQKYGLDFTILRYGSLYGPRSNEENGLYQIVRRAIECHEIIYPGPEETIREYIHVQDAASASIEALDPKFLRSALTITGQEMMKVKDVLEILSEILGSPRTLVKFLGDDQAHYVRTPFVYKNRTSKKLVLPLHVDIGQGLIELVEQIKDDLGKDQ